MLDLNNRTIYPLGIQPALGNNFEVEEDDIGVYLQGDFRFELGAGHSARQPRRPLRGNRTDLEWIHVHQRRTVCRPK